MKIISISGLDGSGKSTQTQLLKKYYEENGKTVLYFHAVQFSVAHVLYKRAQKKHPHKKCVDITSAPWHKIALRKIALFCDIFRFRYFVYKNKKHYDILLTDRYFYDMIINIAYLQHKPYTPFFARWIIPPNHRFFLDVTPAYIMMRDNPPSQGHDYLVAKNTLFHQYIPQIFDLTVIDGSKYVTVVHDDIRAHVTHL